MVTQQLILVRGIPGEGKTTFAKMMFDTRSAVQPWVWLEQDHWRDHPTGRIYKDRFNGTAGAWCLGRAADALRNPLSNVIVSNTFATVIKLQPYFLLAEELNMVGHDIRVTVLHVEGEKFGNSVHSSVKYERYADVWQDYKGEFKLDPISRASEE